MLDLHWDYNVLKNKIYTIAGYFAIIVAISSVTIFMYAMIKLGTSF
jgi:hypothetical protein